MNDVIMFAVSFFFNASWRDATLIVPERTMVEKLGNLKKLYLRIKDDFVLLGTLEVPNNTSVSFPVFSPVNAGDFSLLVTSDVDHYPKKWLIYSGIPFARLEIDVDTSSVKVSTGVLI